MKIIASILFLIVLAISSSVCATPRVGVSPSGVCTRDINSWGHASKCSCLDDSIYDERSGLCLEGLNPKEIMVQGGVEAGVMAIGGETTGFVITSSAGKMYELALKTEDQKKLTKLSGMWFEVTGELVTINSPEMKGRKAIIVDKINVLE